MKMDNIKCDKLLTINYQADYLAVLRSGENNRSEQYFSTFSYHVPFWPGFLPMTPTQLIVLLILLGGLLVVQFSPPSWGPTEGRYYIQLRNAE